MNLELAILTLQASQKPYFNTFCGFRPYKVNFLFLVVCRSIFT